MSEAVLNSLHTGRGHQFCHSAIKTYHSAKLFDNHLLQFIIEQTFQESAKQIVSKQNEPSPTETVHHWATIDWHFTKTLHALFVSHKNTSAMIKRDCKLVYYGKECADTVMISDHGQGMAWKRPLCWLLWINLFKLLICTIWLKLAQVSLVGVANGLYFWLRNFGTYRNVNYLK